MVCRKKIFQHNKIDLEDSTPFAFCSLVSLPATNIAPESLGWEDEFQSPRSWMKGSWQKGDGTVARMSN